MNNIKLKNKRPNSYLEGQIIARDFASFMLFVGQEGIGKRDSAISFAKAVLCEKKGGESCQACASCKLVESGNHPDLIKLGGNEAIRIADIRQLQKILYLKPYMAEHKIAIVQNAHLMTEESANALLKILEEPPQESIIILTCPDKKLLPETVISRSQVVNFGTSDSSGKVADEEIAKDALAAIKNSKSIHGKFLIVHKYSKDKDSASVFLNVCEGMLRESLVERQNLDRTVMLLEKIQDSRQYLRRNLASKFVLENLVLTCI